MFSLLFLEIPTAMARDRKKYKPTVCPVKNEPKNLSYYDSDYSLKSYKEVKCYYSWCCDEGCCPWYINLALGILIVIGFILFFKICEKFCVKYCTDISAETARNDSQENMLMVSTNHSNAASNDCLQNYGSGYSTPSNMTPTYFHPKEASLPTYEEATSRQ